MKNNIRFAIVGAISFAVAAVCAVFFLLRADATPFPSQALSGIEEITVSRIGRMDPLTVRFIEPIAAPEALGRAVALRPRNDGSWALRDDRTIEFMPTRPYRADSNILLSVDMGLLSGEAAGKRGFSARYSVAPASLSVVPEGLTADDETNDALTLRGYVLSDIPIDRTEAAKKLNATIGQGKSGKRVDITWNTEGLSAKHEFSIGAIRRNDENRYLTLSWEETSHRGKKRDKTWLIPKREDFRVLEIASEDPARIQVRFSDRLDPLQDARGFVRVGNEINVRYSIEGNVLNLYSADGWKADSEVSVLEGMKSDSGKTLAIPISARISSEWEKPEAKFATDGVILPKTAGVIVPIETKNLRGVIVQAYRIYGDNILQFLQVNELDGTRELARVGEPVWSGSFDFEWNDGMKNRFVPRGVDLSGLIQQDPTGMIQLKISFRRKNVMYECTADHQDFSSLPMPTDGFGPDEDSEYSYWDMIGDLPWEIRRTYWQYKNDPCHPAYYMSGYNSGSLITKNVLVSNLGILAKREAEGTFNIAVADIGTTKPVAGAAVSLYSYAQKKLASGVTDGTGFFRANAPAEPYFAVASKDNQSSYLRIDDGMSLSVSHFPVDGVKADKGVKGFIYGERGVWRPGDDIHLVFIMQDLKRALPKNFPITFELEDPQGRVVKSSVLSSSVDGFYRIDAKTAEEDPSGSWTARVLAGGQSWNKSLRIEAIVPNRLSINLKSARPYLTTDSNEFTLSSAWLHGAPTPGYSADVSVAYYPGTTSFDGYSEYSFMNPESSVETSDGKVWEGALDANSTARFSLDLYAGDNLPGKLRAFLTTRVFEPSGMFSVEQAQYAYSPYDRYVGLRLPKGDATRGMLLTDTKHRVELAVLDAEGKSETKDVTLDMSVYKLQWRWWWEKEALTDATYVTDESRTLIASGTTVAKKGRALWNLEVKYPEWGRYLVVAKDAEGGHSAAKIVYIDWPGWAGRGKDAGTGSAAMLPLTKDKENYRVGESAAISFPSSEGTRALVTIEKNGSIVKQEWLTTSKGTTVWKLPLTADMAPNVYAHITLLQPHMQTANSLPIRLYGVLPVMVEDPATRLAPKILASDAYEPGKKALLRVSESSGRPMTYTVAVVDEGLLGLTRFTTANPWSEFYKKESSRLASWDLYRYVMSAYGGKLETLLSIGGSEDLLNNNAKKTQRFKPVVLFFGPFELAAGATADHSFEMPQYVGAVRVMVTAGKNGSYGVAEQKVPVRGNLMVLPTLPRTLGMGESVEVPVTVFNGLDRKARVSVKLVATGSVNATLEKEVEIDAVSDATVSFALSTSAPGKASVRVSASSAEGVSASASDVDIDVLSRGSPIATVRSFAIKPGERFRDYVPSPGERGTKKMSVELSTLPVLDMQSRLSYLTGYPHGCVEQITSGGFPQLYVPAMMDLREEDVARVKKNVMSVIARYPQYQTSSGGFAYWPGSAEVNSWGTTYAGHFMIEARRAGYEVPDAVFSPWLAFQRDKAKAWERGENAYDVDAQSYRLFSLALSGNPELGAMNRLRLSKDLPFAAKWLLAASYYLAGQRSAASDIARDLDVAPPYYRDTGDNWGSSVRDQAIALASIGIMNDANRATALVPTVAGEFAGTRWFSTQETSWMLIALAPHYQKNAPGEAKWEVEWDKGDISGEIKRSAVIRDLEPFESPTQTVTVKNTGAKPIYGRVVTRGLVPAGEEKPVSGGLVLGVEYRDGDGKRIELSNLSPGKTFTVDVSVKNTFGKKIDNVALSVPIPTCWEFANERIGMEGDSDESVRNYDWRDMKDTHVYTYFSLDRDETKSYRFTATVAYKGSYYVPAIRAEAMYNADIQAVVPGAFVGVRK